MRFSTRRKVDEMVATELTFHPGGCEAIKVVEAIGPALLAAFPDELVDRDGVTTAINASLERLRLGSVVSVTPEENIPRFDQREPEIETATREMIDMVTRRTPQVSDAQLAMDIVAVGGIL